ncbi:HTH-type transcriptional regulator MalT [anaerobic digester metagenome]
MVNFENDKYFPTPLPEICAPRDKLLKRFDHEAAKRVVAVCAPAGYGKAVSALLWIQASKRRSVWIGLDEYDNAPFVFYKLFCTGILSVQPNNEKMEEILSSNAFYSSPIENTIRLLQEFKQDDDPYILVLDDLHAIVNNKILKALPFILALAYYVRAEDPYGINHCFHQLNALYQDFSVEEWINYTSAFVFEKLPEEMIRSNITLLVEATWANFLNGNARATLSYIDSANEFVASGNNRDILLEEDLLGYALTIGFADFRMGLHEFAEAFSATPNTIPEKSMEVSNLYTPSITQNLPYMHRSICDCLDILVDMDGRLQEIHDVFGTFYASEVDIFCTCIWAGLYYEQNQLTKALEAVALAQNQLTKNLRFEMHFCVFMILSHILDATRKSSESKKVRKQFAARLSEEDALYLSPNFYAIDTKFGLWDADQEAAQTWLRQLFMTEDEHLRFYKLYQYFTTARAYIVLSEWEKANELLTKLKRLCVDYHRHLDAAETSVLQSVLYWVTGSQQESMDLLTEVLLAVQPYEVVRIIADEGAAVLPILKKIAVCIDKPDYEGAIEGRYLDQVILYAYEVSKNHVGITAGLNVKPIKLSKQQKYILTLLAQSYKNAEIVKIIGLSLNTIRSHTKIIYQKLGVNTAADAVIEAKQLGIIEL